MSTIKENEKLKEYYLRKKAEKKDWKIELRKKVSEMIDQDKNKLVYCRVDCENGRMYDYDTSKQEYVLVDKHLLDVVKYVEEQGLEWGFDFVTFYDGTKTSYDDSANIVIYW